MLEIKFRMWDAIEKQFMNHSRVIETRILDLERNGQERFIYQQYTGLEDNNGNEIYEGDILRIDCNFEHRKGIVVDKVDYWNCSFSTSEWLFHELIDNDEKGKQKFEVIGNIYENPELLEGR